MVSLPPVQILAAEPADCRTMAEVDWAAFGDDPVSQTLFGSATEATLSHRTEEIAKSMAEDPTVQYTKAVIDGKLVAWARWNFYIDGSGSKEEDRTWPEGANVEACEEFFGLFDQIRKDRMGEKRYACMRFCFIFLFKEPSVFYGFARFYIPLIYAFLLYASDLPFFSFFLFFFFFFFIIFFFFFFFFFFQAEDGIRDLYVTGVQTCALPISDAGSDPGDPVTSS